MSIWGDFSANMSAEYAERHIEAKRAAAELVASLHLPQQPLDWRDSSADVDAPEPEFCGHHGRGCECDAAADDEWAGRWGA